LQKFLAKKVFGKKTETKLQEKADSVSEVPKGHHHDQAPILSNDWYSLSNFSLSPNKKEEFCGLFKTYRFQKIVGILAFL